jgi:hypothetical protein
MTIQINFAERFGLHLANGEEAMAFRIAEIEPALAKSHSVLFDFSGVRTANSSFINALVTRIVEHHGEAVLERLVFKGCSPALRVLVESAVFLGIQKSQEHAAA